MGLDRDEAWAHLCTWTETEALRKHARAVELVMRAAAHEYGRGAEDEEVWGIAGMLHDADYERWPEEHPKRIVAWLREAGGPDDPDGVLRGLLDAGIGVRVYREEEPNLEEIFLRLTKGEIQ